MGEDAAMDPEAGRIILSIAVGAVLAFIAGEIRASRDASRRAKEQREAFADAERARCLAEKREEAEPPRVAFGTPAATPSGPLAITAWG